MGIHAELRPAAAWGPFFCDLPILRSILIDDLKMQGTASPVQKNNLIKQLVADMLQTFSSNKALCTTISFTGVGM